MRRFDTITVDPIGLLWFVAVILLMTGAIAFTPVAVGLLLLFSQVHLNFTFNA